MLSSKHCCSAVPLLPSLSGGSTLVNFEAAKPHRGGHINKQAIREEQLSKMSGSLHARMLSGGHRCAGEQLQKQVTFKEGNKSQ